MRDNLTERRIELTHRKPVLSTLRSDDLSEKNAAPATPKKVVSFAAGSRFLGFALLVHGEVALLQARRLRGSGLIGLDAWILQRVRAHRPDLVVVMGSPAAGHERGRRVMDAVFDAANAVGPTVLRLERGHVALPSGLRRRGPRTDRDRQRAMVGLATAAALAVAAVLRE
ncbi:MAG: hypothetical protein IT373_37880 [Polyangiaceae bacterium]|nr:hypothetical protein [Polyangiaceae bacterium]